MITLTELNDTELLALMLAGEADNQPIDGQVAVLCVPLARLARQRAHYGRTLRQIILMPAQFSTFNDDGDNDPTNNHWSRFISRIWIYHKMAQLAIGGLLRSPVDGATHYCRYDLDPKPRYTLPQYSQFLGRIGAHEFYREH